MESDYVYGAVKEMCIVSVIMGVYNIENLWVFNKAVDSILNQTLSDFELIICDDGSSDNTYNILCDYEKKDYRIKVIQNKQNSGLEYSLNECLNIASGKYIARQDADDISKLNRLERQINFLEKNRDVGFVGSNVNLFDESGVWGKRILPEYPQKEDFLFTAPYVHGTLVFRKDMLMCVGKYKVSKITLRAEDYELEMRLYAAGYIGANIQEILYYFLENEQTQARRKFKYRIDETKIRAEGFKKLKIFPKCIPYIIKPLIVGIIPRFILKMIKKNKYKIKD